MPAGAELPREILRHPTRSVHPAWRWLGIADATRQTKHHSMSAVEMHHWRGFVRARAHTLLAHRRARLCVDEVVLQTYYPERRPSFFALASCASHPTDALTVKILHHVAQLGNGFSR